VIEHAHDADGLPVMIRERHRDEGIDAEPFEESIVREPRARAADVSAEAALQHIAARAAAHLELPA